MTTRVRLFCFPYAGGSASTFRGWRRAAPDGIDIHPVELPGHGARLAEPCFDRLLPLAWAVAGGVIDQLDGPFALFGHSMGALVAFELARILSRHHGLVPARLFVAGRAAPPIPERHITHDLPDPAFRARLLALKGTPPGVLENPELMEIVMPILRADFTASETYQYAEGPPAPCPITAFGGLEDDETSPEELAAWQAYTSAGFERVLFPGDHFFLHTAQDALLRKVAADLAHGANTPGPEPRPTP